MKVWIAAFLMPFCLSSLTSCGLSGPVKVQDERTSFSSSGLDGQGVSHPNDISLSEEQFEKLVRLVHNLDRTRFPDQLQSSQEFVWGLFRCQCFSAMAVQLEKSWTENRGALPQYLSPHVREMAQSMDSLKIFLSLPQSIQRWVEKKFLQADEIDLQISEGIFDMLKNIFPRIKAESMEKIRFDQFVSLDFRNEGSTSFSELYMMEQSTLWSFLFGFEGLWTLSGVDQQALHYFQILRAITDLEYAFGLKQDSQQRPYGGLTISIQGDQTLLGSYDPRTADQEDRFLGGRFRLMQKPEDGLDTLLNLREEWSVVTAVPNLGEQSRLWHAGALLFKKLKPSSRESVLHFFSDHQGLLPEDVHGLGAIILSTMASLLDGPFIDEDSRKIYSLAQLNSNQDRGPEANLMEMIHLSEALLEWRELISNQGDFLALGLDSQRIQTAEEDIQLVLKLLGQKMIQRLDSFQEIVNQWSLAQQFEILSVLVRLNFDVFKSPLFKQKLNQYMQFLLHSIPESQSFDALEQFHLVGFLKRILSYQGNDDVFSLRLKATIQDWEQEASST